jgi:hypothetical protein
MSFVAILIVRVRSRISRHDQKLLLVGESFSEFAPIETHSLRAG